MTERANIDGCPRVDGKSADTFEASSLRGQIEKNKHLTKATTAVREQAPQKHFLSRQDMRQGT